MLNLHTLSRSEKKTTGKKNYERPREITAWIIYQSPLSTCQEHCNFLFALFLSLSISLSRVSMCRFDFSSNSSYRLLLDGWHPNSSSNLFRCCTTGNFAESYLVTDGDTYTKCAALRWWHKMPLAKVPNVIHNSKPIFFTAIKIKWFFFQSSLCVTFWSKLFWVFKSSSIPLNVGKHIRWVHGTVAAIQLPLKCDCYCKSNIKLSVLLHIFRFTWTNAEMSHHNFVQLIELFDVVVVVVYHFFQSLGMLKKWHALKTDFFTFKQLQQTDKWQSRGGEDDRRTEKHTPKKKLSTTIIIQQMCYLFYWTSICQTFSQNDSTMLPLIIMWPNFA